MTEHRKALCHSPSASPLYYSWIFNVVERTYRLRGWRAHMPHMPHMERWRNGGASQRTRVAAARARDIPIIFSQELHRPDRVDSGRALDGTEDVQCVESLPPTEARR